MRRMHRVLTMSIPPRAPYLVEVRAKMLRCACADASSFCAAVRKTRGACEAAATPRAQPRAVQRMKTRA